MCEDEVFDCLEIVHTAVDSLAATVLKNWECLDVGQDVDGEEYLHVSFPAPEGLKVDGGRVRFSIYNEDSA